MPKTAVPRVGRATRNSNDAEYFDPLLILTMHGIDSSGLADWRPEFFAGYFGSERSHLVDCITGDITLSTRPIGKFFSSMSDSSTSSMHTYHKLKDWPSDQAFREKLPLHFFSFHEVLPFPAYHLPDGSMNLASYLPEHILKPDLGPKMYSAHGMPYGLSKIGSTSLHLDIADAVNVMMFASSSKGKRSGVGAIWHIFPQNASRALREFLDSRTPIPPASSKNKFGQPPKKKKKKAKSETAISDQIHDQSRYLDDEMLAELYRQHGVTAYRIEQRVGDAVYIPAGCAHQVYNLKHCIKVAVDYVCPENVGRCRQLRQEIRQLPREHERKEAMIQLKDMIFFTWLSLDATLSSAPSSTLST